MKDPITMTIDQLLNSEDFLNGNEVFYENYTFKPLHKNYVMISSKNGKVQTIITVEKLSELFRQHTFSMFNTQSVLVREDFWQTELVYKDTNTTSIYSNIPSDFPAILIKARFPSSGLFLYDLTLKLLFSVKFEKLGKTFIIDQVASISKPQLNELLDLVNETANDILKPN